MEVTVLPDAGREEMLEAASLTDTQRMSGVRRRGYGPDHVLHVDDIERDLGERDDFLRAGGWSAVGPGEGGLVAHRGVLHEDEYVDPDLLQVMIERRLGFTYADIAAVYRAGRPTADMIQLRDKIDSRLLDLSRSGGNMIELAKALGWAISPATEKGGESCKMMERALHRARAAA